jgi:hypothetical protein
VIVYLLELGLLTASEMKIPLEALYERFGNLKNLEKAIQGDLYHPTYKLK